MKQTKEIGQMYEFCVGCQIKIKYKETFPELTRILTSINFFLEIIFLHY